MGRLLFGAAAWRSAAGEVRGILKLSGLRQGAALDAACGTGRHSLALARQGFRVVGIDTSAAYLREARERGRGLNVAFKRAELRSLEAFRGRFDLVLNLFSSFGYYPKAADNVATLRQMAAALKPGGALALELMPRESLQRHVIPLDSRPVPGGRLFEARRWIRSGAVLETQLLWQREGKRAVERTARMQTYSQVELAGLFKRAGFKAIRAYGDYRGGPFKIGGPLLILGRKA
jgi:SAM-dependent methyltransferase